MTAGHPGGPLAELYLSTLVAVEQDGAMVPAHRSRLAAHGPFHVITAWNPGQERPDAGANDAADQRLHRQLLTLGVQPVRAVGADPASDHAEPSWAVPGLTDEQARALGRQYRQVAVFRITAGEQTVLACTEHWRASRPLP